MSKGITKRWPNRIGTLEACARAAELLKDAGFERVATSMRSEACYYRLPGRHGALRVASHGKCRGEIGLHSVVAKLTFKGNSFDGPDMMTCSEEAFLSRIWLAVGRYVMSSSAPRVSRYQGPRGTWEHDNPASEPPT